MQQDSKQEIVSRLLDEMTALTEEYYASMDRDKIFGVRKSIRLRLKEIQKRIEELKSAPAAGTSKESL